jgi:hypothetical protein
MCKWKTYGTERQVDKSIIVGFNTPNSTTGRITRQKISRYIRTPTTRCNEHL